jgi:hypothetical protein
MQESDPLNQILGALAKLDKESRATIQVLIKPTSGDWRRAVDKTAHKIVENKPLNESGFTKFINGLLEALSSPKDKQFNEKD